MKVVKSAIWSWIFGVASAKMRVISPKAELIKLIRLSKERSISLKASSEMAVPVAMASSDFCSKTGEDASSDRAIAQGSSERFVLL